MRTAIITLGGFVLWAICLGIAKAFAGAGTPSMTAATGAFVVLWFLVTALNMLVGVTQAGYSFRDELPIFLLIFLLPVAVAVFVRWKWL